MLPPIAMFTIVLVQVDMEDRGKLDPCCVPVVFCEGQNMTLTALYARV
jgi:hypothetical protein